MSNQRLQVAQRLQIHHHTKRYRVDNTLERTAGTLGGEVVPGVHECGLISIAKIERLQIAKSIQRHVAAHGTAQRSGQSVQGTAARLLKLYDEAVGAGSRWQRLRGTGMP